MYPSTPVVISEWSLVAITLLLKKTCLHRFNIEKRRLVSLLRRELQINSYKTVQDSNIAVQRI